MLSPREKKVAEKIFCGFDEREACRSHNMRYDRLVELYENEEFVSFLEVLYKNQIRKSQIELSRFGVSAVRRLGKLVDNEKDEVARRAAVDILNKCQELAKNKSSKASETQQPGCELSDDQARAMLSKLAKASSG